VDAIQTDTRTINTPAGPVRAGSVVVLSNWGGGTSTVTVLNVEDDIKNGCPGLDAVGRWAYADQVQRVVTF
jgi:hypothetical protein